MENQEKMTMKKNLYDISLIFLLDAYWRKFSKLEGDFLISEFAALVWCYFESTVIFVIIFVISYIIIQPKLNQNLATTQ
jgi:hypothetical protein